MVRRRVSQLRDQSERGTVLVMVCGLLVVLIALTAYTIDSGSGRQAQQRAQSAADSAALAAVDAIPANNTSPDIATVSQTASTMATTNDPGASVSVTMPTPTTARVTVSHASPNSFGQALGNRSTPVSATAVATASGAGGSPGAIVTGIPSCLGAITEVLGALDVQGSVIDDGSFIGLLSGNTISGNLIYRTSCLNLALLDSFSIGGTVTASPASTGTDVQTPEFPVDYRTAYANPCNAGNTANWSWGLIGLPLGTVTLNGIYCSNAPVVLAANVVRGSATIIAPSITVLASTSTLTPYWNNLTYWQTGSSPMSLTLSALNGGTVFAPTANLTVIAGGASLTGFLEVGSLTLAVGGLNIIGTGPAIGGSATATLTQ